MLTARKGLAPIAGLILAAGVLVVPPGVAHSETPSPVGLTIRLTAAANGNYVEVNTATADARLEATVSSPGTSTEFVVEDAGNGMIYLKSMANGMYVEPNLAKTAAPLEATAATAGPSTAFTWQDVSGNTIRLIAASNSKWVSTRADEPPGYPLKASISANPGGWTNFVWEDADTPLPASVSIEQTVLGNIFTQPQEVEFAVAVAVAATEADKVSWVVFDSSGARVADGREPLDGGAAVLRPPANEVGHYRLDVSSEREGVVVASARTTFAVVEPFTAPEDSPFGFATHFGQSWSPDLVPLIATAGADSIRDEMYWKDVESTKGTYHFPAKHDKYMSELEEHGIDPLIIFAYTNPHYDGGAVPYTDESRAAFADYGLSILDRYGDQIPWVEVYNEFSGHFGDIGDGPADSKPEYYFELLKATYLKVKAQHPDLPVVGAATAGVPMQWLEDLFALGGLDYMDALSVHYPGQPGDPEGATRVLRDLKDLIAQHNDGEPIPIWITEQGWTTRIGGQGVSEDTQARYLVRSHVIALSEGVQRYFWYDFANDGADPARHEANFGLVRRHDDDMGKWTPKPSYAAYATMTRQLAGAEFRRQEPIGDGLHSYQFTKAGKQIRVVWSTAGPQAVTIETPEPVTVMDLTGRSQTYYPDKGRVFLSASEDPIYVSGRYGEIQAGGKYKLTGNGLAITGEPIELTLTVDNSVPPRAPVNASFEVGGVTVAVSAEPGEQVTIPIAVPDQGVAGRREVVGRLLVNGKPVARVAAHVDMVENPLTLDAKHVLRDDAEVLVATVTNIAGAAVPVDGLAWQVGELTGVAELPAAVPGGTSHEVVIPLAGLAAPASYPVELRLTVPGRPDVVNEATVVKVDRATMRLVAHHTITVDGVLDALSGVPGIDLDAEGEVMMDEYGGVPDLSGDFWFTWDADHLYLSAALVDDVHAQPATGGSIWQGDSIQFAVTPGVLDESPNWYEYGIALTAAGPQVYRWATAGAAPIGPVTDVSVKVTRDESANRTVYELALPWEQLAPIVPADRLLSLSLLVNDNDGGGRKGWIEWGSGIGRGKNPALYNPSVLVPAS